MRWKETNHLLPVYLCDPEPSSNKLYMEWEDSHYTFLGYFIAPCGTVPRRTKEKNDCGQMHKLT